jgi:hypothetical protein
MKHRRDHHLIADIIGCGVCIMALAVNVILVAVPSSAKSESPQQKCEKEYTKYLESYVNHTETPKVPDCKNMTDSQWYAINARTDKLHNEITEMNFASK